MQPKELMLTACIFIAVIFAVYSIHIPFYLPFHSEEYDHLKLAKLTEQNKIPTGMNWEAGFSVFLAVTDSLLLGKLALFLAFIPIIFGIIISFSSFLLGRLLFRNSLAGLFFALFSLMVSSSPEIMGLWFATPNAMALSLIPFLLYFFIKGTTNKKIAFIFIILFAFTSVIHPAFTLLLIPLIAVYLFINPKLFERNQFKIAVGLTALLLLIPFFASRIGLTESSLDFSSFSAATKNAFGLLVWQSITQYSPKFFVPEYTGYYLLALAGIGAGLIIMQRLLIEFKRRKKTFSVMEKEFIVSKHQIILPLMLIILGFLFVHFNLKNYTFIAPYERMFLAFLLILALNAAAGTFILWKTINQKLPMHSKPLSTAFIALVLLLLVSVPFMHENELYKNIELNGMPAINWINEFLPETGIIAIPKHSSIIQAFTKNTVFASPPTRAGIPDDFQLEGFFFYSCEKKTEIISQTKAQYVFGSTEFSCESTDKIYDKKGFMTFKVNSDS